MSGSPETTKHLVRMAGLFVVGITAFLVLRWLMVPAGFGSLGGHYRPGAIADAAARPLHYAGRAACEDCHGDVVAERKGSKHENIGCEACHGPQMAHVEAQGDKKPPLPDSTVLCPRCHAASPWKPKAYPQIVVAEHNPGTACTGCHKAHAPKLS